MDLLPILSKTESYSVDNAPRKMKPSEKIEPYKGLVAQKRVMPMLSSIVEEAKSVDENTLYDGNLVTKLILHPSYLAKSYYPKDILDKYELENIGSKEVLIKPEERVTVSQKKNEKIASSQLFVSGRLDSFKKLLDDIKSSKAHDVEHDLRKIEKLSLFEPSEKYDKKNLNLKKTGMFSYEVVLYSSSQESDVFKSFSSYIKTLNGKVLHEKANSIDGLTFVCIELESSEVKKLAAFSYVRVVRIAPVLKLTELQLHSELHVRKKGEESLSLSNKVADIAVFDAGLSPSHRNHPSIRYFDLTNSIEDTVYNIDHGSKVASAIVYGDQGCNELVKDVLSIDHYKVYSHLDVNSGPQLYDVLKRIKSVLSHKKYRFVNICLGPSFPRPDNEPNLWTSQLDKLAESGETLFIIAAGNDGECIATLGESYARIQPPADMLNGLSVGAADSRCSEWDRADYSCIGPGRRPGHVKPDVMYFGGNELGEKVQLTSLDTPALIEDFGTSFAAPLVTRQAALIDKYTGKKLSISTIRALLIHSAQQKGERIHNGWGKVPSNINEYLFCNKNRVTFIYQGILNKKSGVRAALPFSEEVPKNAKINLDATLCFYTDVDIKNPVSYSKTGVLVTFKPHIEKLAKNSTQPKTRGLFTKQKIFGNEQHLRDDLHKWETCFKVKDRMEAKSLFNPVFDIRFSERDDGHDYDSKNPLHYSLVATVEVEHKDGSVYDLYNKVLGRYPLLNPIELDVPIDVGILEV